MIVGLSGCVTADDGLDDPDVTTTSRVETPAADGVVTWIDDGDSIEVATDEGMITVRLVATNAPDRGECHADVALDHLIDTLKEEPVRLEVMGIDQFDRTLAHVFTGDRHINLEMVELGLSLASTPDEDDPYRSAILEGEEHAFDDGLGLWAPDACGSSGPIPDVDIDAASSEYDPAGPDDDVLDQEALVLFNDGDTTVNLGGWILRDESTRHRYTFQANVSLAPGESYTVSSADSGWDPGGSSVWNNGGDMALLQLPDGTVVSRWRY